MYSKGTNYIIDAILMAYNNTELLSNISYLYEKISIQYNENINKIQRSIRSSIDNMNSHISKEHLRSFFYIYNNDVITPKYFFITIVDYFINTKK